MVLAQSGLTIYKEKKGRNENKQKGSCNEEQGHGQHTMFSLGVLPAALANSAVKIRTM